MSNSVNSVYVKNTSNGYLYRRPDCNAILVYSFLEGFRSKFNNLLYKTYIDNIIIPLVWEEYKNECTLLKFKKNAEIFFNTDFVINSSIYDYTNQYKVILNNSNRNKLLFQNICSFLSKLNEIYLNMVSLTFNIYDYHNNYYNIFEIMIAKILIYVNSDFTTHSESKNTILSIIDKFIKYLNELKSKIQEYSNTIDSIIDTILDVKSELEILT